MRTDRRWRPRAQVSRSWLLASAERSDEFDALEQSAADQLVLDLEDAVDPSRKGVCRDGVARWLSSGGSAWVRVNDRVSDAWADDMAGLRDLPGLRGVMLAKTEHADHVTDTWAALGGHTPVLALVESAVGIENATVIASAKGAFRLAFGSGDYRRDTGTAADDLALAYPRSRLVVASRVGQLPGPIDGPSVGVRSEELRRQCAVSVSLGLMGKLCVAAEQLPVLNEAFSPSRVDVEWAQGVLADFEARGRKIKDGSDRPRVGRAERIMQLAAEFDPELASADRSANN